MAPVNAMRPGRSSSGQAAAFQSSLKHHAPCRWGSTPLKNAVMGGHKLVCDLIRSHGGRLDMENAAKTLAQAANEGDINRILLLIENGVPVDETDYDGRTALHLAATEGLLLSAYILIYR